MSDKQETQEQETQETQEIDESQEEISEETQEEEEQEEEFSKEDRSALMLLKDPRTRRAMIRAMAESEGLELGTKETKQETKAGLSERLKEALGEEWEFLSTRLSPVLQSELDAIKASVREELGQTEEKNRDKALRAAEKQFFRDNPEAKTYRNKMANLAQKYPPPEEGDVEEYLSDLFTLASQRKGSITDAVERKRRDRINKIKGSDNLTGGSRTTQTKEQKSGLSRKDSILAAAKALGFDK